MGIKHQIEHDLTLDLARRAIDRAMESYRARFAKYEPYFRWEGERTGAFGFRAKGLKVSGEIELEADRVLVDVQVPLILRAFKGKALDVIDREVRAWIGKARAGAL